MVSNFPMSNLLSPGVVPYYNTTALFLVTMQIIHMILEPTVFNLSSAIIQDGSITAIFPSTIQVLSNKSCSPILNVASDANCHGDTVNNQVIIQNVWQNASSNTQRTSPIQ